MRPPPSLSVFFLATVLLGQQKGIAPRSGAPAVDYALVPDWPAQALSAAGAPAGPWNLIQAPGVAIDSRGHVLVLHRGAHPILEFESGGKFVRSWGDGMFSEGKVVAVPANIAPRTPPAIRRFMVPPDVFLRRSLGACGSGREHLGRRRAGPSDLQNEPARQGDSTARPERSSRDRPRQLQPAHRCRLRAEWRILCHRWIRQSPGRQVHQAGKYLLQWGTRGSGPGQFQLPHNIAVDAQGRVYVTDRDNRRIQVFDANGKFITSGRNWWRLRPSDHQRSAHLDRRDPA